MQKTTLFRAALLGGLLFSLIGCAGSKRGHSDADSSAGGGVGDTFGGVGDTLRFYGTDVSPGQEKQLLEKHVYYFGYDRFDLNNEDLLSLYAHAKRLITKPKAHIRVEGHTDERGSREYNIALGERRAQCVANVLSLKGVPQHQITVVSYGKERPATQGHDESAWSLNRRAQLEYEAN